MTTGLRGCVSVLVFGLTAGAAQAQDCSWYARKALEQQKRNAELKCGLQGPEWTRDLAAHLAWCKGVAPLDWQKQAQLRDQLLTKCPPAK